MSCLNLPAAEETYPFGDEVAVTKVGGKMFALVPLLEEPGSVNLKCDPAQRSNARDVPRNPPGYHQNKRHWNTVDLDGSVEGDVVHGLLADSRRPGRRRPSAFDSRRAGDGLTWTLRGGKTAFKARWVRTRSLAEA